MQNNIYLFIYYKQIHLQYFLTTYGVVAVVTVFTTFFSIFSDMGLSTAVIQNKDLGKDDVNLPAKP